MNLKTLRSLYRSEYYRCDVDLDVSNDIAYITVSLNGREVVSVTVPKKDKKEVYLLMVTLLSFFDFSYFLEFDSVQSLKDFLCNYEDSKL